MTAAYVPTAVACTGTQQCNQFNGPGTPGVCLDMNTPALPVSYEKHTCTHQPYASNYTYMTNLCQASQGSQQGCESNLFCKWNGEVVDCPVPNSAQPTTMGCSQDGTYQPGWWDTKTCAWSCPINPNTTVDNKNTCVHNITDSTNRTKIDQCPTFHDSQSCEQNACAWNYPVPLFSRSFCHPAVLDATTTGNDWS